MCVFCVKSVKVWLVKKRWSLEIKVWDRIPWSAGKWHPVTQFAFVCVERIVNCLCRLGDNGGGPGLCWNRHNFKCWFKMRLEVTSLPFWHSAPFARFHQKAIFYPLLLTYRFVQMKLLTVYQHCDMRTHKMEDSPCLIAHRALTGPEGSHSVLENTFLPLQAKGTFFIVP